MRRKISSYSKCIHRQKPKKGKKEKQENTKKKKTNERTNERTNKKHENVQERLHLLKGEKRPHGSCIIF